MESSEILLLSGEINDRGRKTQAGQTRAADMSVTAEKLLHIRPKWGVSMLPRC